jgi:hypothetical protein
MLDFSSGSFAGSLDGYRTTSSGSRYMSFGIQDPLRFVCGANHFPGGVDIPGMCRWFDEDERLNE